MSVCAVIVKRVRVRVRAWGCVRVRIRPSFGVKFRLCLRVRHRIDEAMLWFRAGLWLG